jgi:uncharacterized MAPEG superfamily protein
MSLELTYLLWSVFLAVLYLNAHGILLRMNIGFGPDVANRDQVPELDVRAQRAKRAFANLLETWPMFIALVVVAELSGRQGWLITWGTIIWFWARVGYLPCYIFGWGQLRSAVWTVALIGLAMMFVGLLL